MGLHPQLVNEIAIRFGNATVLTVPTRNGKTLLTYRQSTPVEEFGVAIARADIGGECHFSGTAEYHMIGIDFSSPVLTEREINGQRSQIQSGNGSMCLCPAGAGYSTTFHGPMKRLILRIAPECLLLARAELQEQESFLTEKSNARDSFINHVAWTLHIEAERNYPNGMLFWSAVTDALLNYLVRNHHSVAPPKRQGRLDPAAIRKIEEYIQDNLSEPLDLHRLAAVAGCGRYKFARLFFASTGVSPHRYVIRRRLEAARSMIRQRRASLAEVAALTGFTDQSHMTGWMKRIYGATPAKMSDPRFRG